MKRLNSSYGAYVSYMKLENFIHLQQVRSRCCLPMRGKPRMPVQSTEHWTVGGSDRRAMTGSAHNDTSALHASLHGAVRREPPEGESPMRQVNWLPLAECPTSRGMRSNLDV